MAMPRLTSYPAMAVAAAAAVVAVIARQDQLASFLVMVLGAMLMVRCERERPAAVEYGTADTAT